jgi:hypothetical protein
MNTWYSGSQRATQNWVVQNTLIKNQTKTKPLALQPWQVQAAVNTVPLPKFVQMRSRWLAYSPNTSIQIILIQQPEPSGREIRESQVRNRAWEILLTRHLLILCKVILHAVDLQHGTDGFTPPPKEFCTTDFYHPKKSTVLSWIGTRCREPHGSCGKHTNH